jgi:hypothetical protein
MTDSTVVVVTVVRLETAGKEIQAAGKAFGTMLDHTRAAAKAIADSMLNVTGTLAARVDAVYAAYADDLKSVDHNVKAIFKDCLLLCLAPDTSISLDGKVDGKKVEVQTTAKSAVDMSKHNLKEAAKQVREANDMARAAGGGRKPATPTVAPPQVTADTEELAFAAWLANVPVYAGDKTRATRVQAAFEDIGITFKLAK